MIINNVSSNHGNWSLVHMSVPSMDLHGILVVFENEWNTTRCSRNIHNKTEFEDISMKNESMSVTLISVKLICKTKNG